MLKCTFRAQAPKTGFLSKLKSLGNVMVTGVEGGNVKVGPGSNPAGGSFFCPPLFLKCDFFKHQVATLLKGFVV